MPLDPGLKHKDKIETLEKTRLWPHVHEFFIRRRVFISWILFLLLLVRITLRQNFYSLSRLSGTLRIAGLLLIAMGLVLRSWAAGVIKKNDSLATSGPYVLTRHPLYIGSLILLAGFLDILGDGFNLLPFLILVFFVYWPTIHKEENSLREKFGSAWQFYARRVGILFPKKLPWPIEISWSWAQWQKNKEYKALAGALVVLIVLGFGSEFSTRNPHGPSLARNQSQAGKPDQRPKKLSLAKIHSPANSQALKPQEYSLPTKPPQNEPRKSLDLEWPDLWASQPTLAIPQPNLNEVIPNKPI